MNNQKRSLHISYNSDDHKKKAESMLYEAAIIQIKGMSISVIDRTLRRSLNVTTI